MQPEQNTPAQQPYQPVQPQQTLSYSPEHIAAIRKSNQTKLIWGLICLIAPTALLIVSILLYAVFNFVSGGYNSSGGMVTTIINIIMFLAGAISVLTWLPGIVAGIVLLATRQKV